MTRETDKPTLVRKIVMVFDICSSTILVEDLKSTDNLDRWRNLLIDLKAFLMDRKRQLHFEIYKFTGDGWILLFPSETTKNALLDFISDLTTEFHSYLGEHVQPCLQRTPKILGLTAGVDSGELIRLEMNEQYEYLGRAINVACRLQGETKGLKGGPSDRVLFSKNCFNSMGEAQPEFRIQEVKVQLRNIAIGNDYECFLWEILA
jgi:class 3 adenylate cyclase